MPAAIPFVAGIAAKAYAVSLGIGTLGASIIGGVVTFAAGRLLQKEPETADFGFDYARGLNQNITNPIQPIPVIYGSTRVAGSRVFAEVSGSSNKYLHLVIAFGEGEIEAIDTIYLDDVEYTDSRFSGLVDFGDGISAHTGTDAQTADTALVSRLSSWTTAHRLRGVAYVYLRLKYDPEAFPRVPVVTADLRGTKVYNLGTGTTAYSRNPANIIYDYLTNTRYGRGIPSSEIDTSSFTTAESICDALISNPPEPSQATYTCDGLVDTSRPTLDNLRDLLTACRGYLIFTGGQYRLIVDQAEASSMTFDSSNMVGGVTINLDGKDRRVNRVRVKYFNAERKHEPDLIVFDNSTDRTADNGTLLEAQFTLPFTTDEYRARRIAELEQKQSRYSITIQFSTTLDGLRAEVGDVVSITYAPASWTAKKFRILGIEFDSLDTVKIRAQEYASIYTPSAPPAVVSPPAVTFPPVNKIEDSVGEPATYWIESFEASDLSDWSDDDGTIEIDTDSCIGDLAALVTHGGGGNTASASIALPASFAANVLSAANNQIRLNLWHKQPAAGAASGFKIRLVGSSEDSGWQTFTTSASCAADGFVWKPSTVQTSLSVEIQGDSTDAGTGATIVDNLVAYVLPDFIDTSNIGTWLGTLAVGSAYIADAAITEAKIGTAAITEAKIGSLAVTTAKIKDLAVETAKIKNLNVTTDKIENDGVTIKEQSMTAAYTSLATSYTSVQSKAITTGGGQVHVFWSATVRMPILPAANTTSTLVQLKRGSTVIHTWGAVVTMTAYSANQRFAQISGEFVDTPTSGSYTYYLEAYRSGPASPDIGNRQLVLVSIKK